jgi:hypothetical protein
MPISRKQETAVELEFFLELRRKLDAVILEHIATAGGYAQERLLVAQAADTLSAMTGRGGSTRQAGEMAIIELIKKFDSTRGDGLGPWPLSKFLMEREAEI